MLIHLMGPEGSGNHLLYSLLTKHPDIQIKLPCSYPAGLYEKCKWPQIPDSEMPVVVLCRDKTCAINSAKRRNFYNIHDDNFNDYDYAIKIMNRQIMTHQGPIIFCSYETLVTWSRKYFVTILKQLNVDLSKYPWRKFSKFTDENKKYIREMDTDGKFIN